ncbi:hypothetical protein QAD02_015384 [Eretmocerus hayati]|uniref:Uncharacterized protein n=2 Tax=Eretmocerus hayati TaxID=131215 RepID=A0ACC2NUA7_9HYME|nr:hypothetical protein QAD02_005156 [Eretmocerus hayati]KAJ8679597.1 hypothetical protein QAD02_015384 [Eretmocerus hayati]
MSPEDYAFTEYMTGKTSTKLNHSGSSVSDGIPVLDLSDPKQLAEFARPGHKLKLQYPSRKSGEKRKISQDDSLSKKKSKGSKDLYRQPTVEELNQLKETENLFHSNLFRLQIEEVLNATKIKQTENSLIHGLRVSKNVWLQFQIAKNIHSCEVINGVRIPMQDLPNDCVGTLSYAPPSCIMVGGSYLFDTVVGPHCTVDVLIEMPESLFQKIDSRNYRYMRKKAMYLSIIASNINQELSEAKSFVGNNANPLLKIVPPGKLGTRVTVVIHVVVQGTTFLMNTCTPGKNNVRPNWFFNADDKNRDINPPSPFYNGIVLQDLSSVTENLHCSKMVREYANIRDGIVLLKIWLKQRELSGHLQSFNGHIITMCVLYLLFVKKLNTFMSSYQIVRNTWQYLASSNWCKEGISMCQDVKACGRINEYHKHYDSVFLGPNGFLNLTANVLEDALLWVSNQAKQSIDCLNNTRINDFKILFMRQVPFYKAFDQMICVHNVKALENVIEAHSDDAGRLNYGPNKYESAVKLILKVLKQGLGQRVSLMCCPSRKMNEWDTGDEIPTDLEIIYIGMQLNPDFSMNILDRGPSANLPEAEAFRKFWGDKSELRRFKDGTICEVVVWQKSHATLAKKRAIPLKVAKYLLERKVKLFENKHFYFFSNQVEDYLKLNKVKVSKFSYGPEQASLQVINVFASLEKEITGLTELPLSVSGLQGCSPLFRYSDPFPPLACVRKPDDTNVLDGDAYLRLSEEPVAIPYYLAPINAVLQLSTSGKWPDDLTALRLTKAAFHLQIAERLRSQCKLRARGLLNHIEIMKVS